MSTLRNRRPTLLPLLALLLTALLGGTPGAEAKDELRLRVNDLAGRPGALVAVVVRTYAPRGVGQGQICLRATGADALHLDTARLGELTSPLATLEGVRVLAAQEDVTAAARFDATRQLAVVEFASPSATINAEDGPLVVFYLRLDEALAADRESSLAVDLDETFLIGAQGEPIAVEPVSGRLRVRSAEEPYELALEGASVAPGETAHLVIETGELFAVSRGVVTLRYDPALVAGPPRARLDPRRGNATLTAELLEPGLLRLEISSPDGTFNRVPGELITVAVPIATTAAPGTRSSLSLVPGETHLVAPDGRVLPLELEAGHLEVEGGGWLHFEGVEVGSPLSWPH